MIYPDYASYRKAWADAYEKDSPVPLNVDLELAAVCNLACPFCHFGESEFAKDYLDAPDWDGLKIRRLMPKDMAFKIIDECAEIGVPALKFNFRGESVLHRDYGEIVEYAQRKITDPKGWAMFGAVDCMAGKPKFHELLSNTNGNIPPANWGSAIRGLMACTKVMVSLDSCHEETYRKMRIGGSLESALKTIHELKKQGHRNLWVRRVIAEENKHEDFVGDVKRIFGDDQKVSEHFAFNGRNKDYQGCLNATPDPNWERQFCGYPAQRCVITASGEFVPCCVSWRGELRPTEHYPSTTIKQYWDGAWRKKLVQELRANVVTNEVCRSCTSYMAYRRPERNFVKDIEGKASLGRN